MLLSRTDLCLLQRRDATRAFKGSNSAPPRRLVVSDAAKGSSATTSGSLAALAALAIALGAHQPLPVEAKPALLDLPSCNKFKDAGGPIKFCEVREGSGESPMSGDLIVVDYTARAVATGQIYDGSTKFAFTLGNDEVIPGWEAGIIGTDYIPPVKENGTRTLLIPPELAYGERGDGCLFGRDESCRIPPNSPVEITFKYKGLGY